MIPGLGRSPGEGKDYPLQYSGLEHSMDCIVPGVAKSKELDTTEKLSLHMHINNRFDYQCPRCTKYFRVGQETRPNYKSILNIKIYIYRIKVY